MLRAFFSALLVPLAAEAAPNSGAVDNAIPPPFRPSEEAFLAVVVPRRSVELAASRDGVVATVAVQLGDRVGEGATVVTLETNVVLHELAFARSSFREAEAQKSKAVIRADKAAAMLDRIARTTDAYSEAEREDARFDRQIAVEELRIAGMKIEQEGENVKRFEELLARSIITAPFSGTVAARLVDPGATVTVASPIVRLISTDDLLVRFAITEEASRKLKPDDAVWFIPDGEIDALPCRLEHLSPEVDAALQLVIAEAKPADPLSPKLQIRPGLPGRVRLRAPDHSPK